MKTFAQAELEGWDRNAADYDAVVLPATSQAFGPILENLDTVKNAKVLEMASGTGHLSEELQDDALCPEFQVFTNRRLAQETLASVAVHAPMNSSGNLSTARVLSNILLR